MCWLPVDTLHQHLLWRGPGLNRLEAGIGCTAWGLHGKAVVASQAGNSSGPTALRPLKRWNALKALLTRRARAGQRMPQVGSMACIPAGQRIWDC